jgi:hypothetical protein
MIKIAFRPHFIKLSPPFALFFLFFGHWIFCLVRSNLLPSASKYAIF